jgi:hypothetical protein
MKRLPLLPILVLASIAVCAPRADAALIGSVVNDDCVGCEDMKFTMSLDLTAGIYTLTFKIEESNENDFGVPWIDAVDFKVSNGDLTGLALTTVPGGLSWGPPEQGNKSASGFGCGTGGGSGFVCADPTSAANMVPTSATALTWVFTWTGLAAGKSIIPTSDWHTGAGFSKDATGDTKGLIISLDGGTAGGDSDGGSIPEPSSLLLMGGGLLGVALGIRRRMKR